MAKATRRCLSCKADISARGNKSVRCKPCQVAYRDLRLRDDPTRSVCVDADENCSKSRLKRGRCSKHYYTARRDNGGTIPQQPRACVMCGIIFTPIRSDAGCCSSLCNSRKQDAKDKVDYPERACETCGVMFKPRRYDTTYCRIECIADPRKRAQRLWQEKNTAKASAYRYQRQAKQRENPDSVPVTERDWNRLVNRYRRRCAYCDDPLDLVTIDHVVPVNRGGRHGIGNVLPACRPCNSAKRDILLFEFKLRRRLDAERRAIVKAQLSRATALDRIALAGGFSVGPGILRFEQLALELCG